MENYLNTLLISPTTIKKYGNINLNNDDTKIGAAIRTAQNIYLADIIGIELVQKLQDLVYNKIQSLEGDKIDDEDMIAYKTLLDDYVEPVLVYRSIVELAIIQTLQIRNFGVVKNSDTNVNQTSSADMQYISDYYRTMYDDAVNKMVAFLCENHKAIPESKYDCNCGSKPLFANTNLWLG